MSPAPSAWPSPATPAPTSCSSAATCDRPGPALVDAFTDGVLSQGVDVVDIGLASSDMVYFAAGHLDRPGVIFTASHNPAEYNGAKFCLEGARPVGVDGLGEIKAVASTVLDGHGPATAARAGTRREARPAAGVRRARAVVRRRRRDPPAAGRRRHRQRHGRPRRAGRLRAHPGGRARGHVRRARRHVPEPPGRPAAAGEPARPAPPRQDRRLRRRAGLRRRCRPRVRRRRARRRAVRVDDDGDPRRRRAAQPAGRARSCTT